MKIGVGKKVFVGMSGGVDSSVTAALLQQQGFDVTGIFIKVWQPNWLPCTWKDERRDAMRVAAQLGIPFKTYDFTNAYKQGVVDYMLTEYSKGRTPNPDVMCNKEIKFGQFLHKALSEGADHIATGHYAQCIKNTNGIYELHEGNDKNKDQSYFLWTLTQEMLEHVLFPIGEYQKKEVRKIAEKLVLSTATKKDSQGICFIGKVGMKEFLQHYISHTPGDVLNENAEVIGKHDGAVLYTFGERHGFTITNKSAHDEAYYVLGKNIEKNTITVSQKSGMKTLQNIRSVTISSPHWITVPPNVHISQSLTDERLNDEKYHYQARIRYRQKPQECQIDVLDNEHGHITFKDPQDGVSPGQSLVLYEGNRCLGGGIIE